MKQTNMLAIPLNRHTAADPAWRRAVVGRLDFHTPIQVHRAFAVLVVAKRFQRQGLKRRLLFGEHGSDLAFGGAVNPRIGPAFFPTIQMSLRFFQVFEAKPFQRRFLCVADTRLDLALVESHRMQVVWDPPPADSALTILFIHFVAPSTNW